MLIKSEKSTMTGIFQKGVLRQAKRMKLLSKKTKKKYIIADFVCLILKEENI